MERRNFLRRLKAKQNVITVNKKIDILTFFPFLFFLNFDMADNRIELFAVTNELHVRSLKVIAGSIAA